MIIGDLSCENIDEEISRGDIDLVSDYAAIQIRRTIHAVRFCAHHGKRLLFRRMFKRSGIKSNFDTSQINSMDCEALRRAAIKYRLEEKQEKFNFPVW